MIKRSCRFQILFFFLFAFHLPAQTGLNLQTSTPEEEGVSSSAIIQFLEAAEKSNHEFHSFMFLRHGKVIAEGWWNPYAPDLFHSMYSVSKSFTSTAVGFAVSEKLLSVDDKVISFFPEDLPDTISSYLDDLSVKDLLTMSAGHDPEPTTATVESSNWIKKFLSIPIVNKPGTKFLYNTAGTYTLSAIVQKVTGQKIIDYLKPRFFEPLGISGIDWEESPQGINTGGWGLRLKTEDMAKAGQFYLQKGNWNGKQLLPEEWINEATSFKIDQGNYWLGADMIKDSSDWHQGYCYQFWRCKNNAYRADGAYGQFIVVMPEKDAVVVFTSETSDLHGELNMVWKYLLPAIRDDKLPADKISKEKLKKILTSLSIPPLPKTEYSPVTTNVSGKFFVIDDNDKQIESVSVKFDEDNAELTITEKNETYKNSFGSGKWISGETFRNGPNLFAHAKENLKILGPFKTMGSFNWKDKNTIQFKLRYIESPHTETITCMFDENKIKVVFENSFDFGKKQLVLNGKMK